MGLSQLICYPQVAHQIDELLPFILNYLSPFGGDSRDSKKEYPYCCFSDRFGSGTLAGGSKILISRRICCLCARRVSWDLRRRQQNPTSKTCLLPLRPTGFMGSTAEAAKSYFQGMFAAFAPDGFHGINGGGSKILLPRHVCCLCAVVPAAVQAGCACTSVLASGSGCLCLHFGSDSGSGRLYLRCDSGGGSGRLCLYLASGSKHPSS